MIIGFPPWVKMGMKKDGHFSNSPIAPKLFPQLGKLFSVFSIIFPIRKIAVFHTLENKKEHCEWENFEEFSTCWNAWGVFKYAPE
jgi:hypothetical protein